MTRYYIFYKCNFLFKHVINGIRYSLKARHTIWQYVTTPDPNIDMVIITLLKKVTSSHYFSFECSIPFKFWTTTILWAMFLNPYWSNNIFLHHIIWTQDLTNRWNNTSLPIMALGVATHLYPLDGSRGGGGGVEEVQQVEVVWHGIRQLHDYHNFPFIPSINSMNHRIMPLTRTEISAGTSNGKYLYNKKNQHITKYYPRPWSWQALVKLVMGLCVP